MSANPESGGGELKNAIKNALRLLNEGNPGLAREQADEILRHYPDEINSLYIVAAALRREGDLKGALQCLQGLAERAPGFALVQQELGFCHAATGKLYAAIECLQKAVRIQAKLPASWRLMGELFLADEDEDSATEAFNQHLLATSVDQQLITAVHHFRAGRIGQAEQLCKQYLQLNPDNVTAMRLLAAIGLKIGVYDDAENLLERCLELAPDFRLARLNYAQVLSKREKLEQSLVQVDLLLDVEPDKFTLLVLKGSTLVKMGDFERALPLYEYLLEHFPGRPMISLVYGHALKTVGEQEQAIKAYRETIRLRADFGDAWWSLANLKTFEFTNEDMQVMRTEIAKEDCRREDHFHLCFALGKALETRRQYDESFYFYQMGNATKAGLEPHSSDNTENNVRRLKKVFDVEFTGSRKDSGEPSPDPVFIVGLPRSGSTLLEQIIASHSMVEGTKELIYIPAMVRRLGGKISKGGVSRYPEILEELSTDEFLALGKEYLDRSREQRTTTAYFIDKMPNNFMHIGLIHLILPNATIIDARRQPMAACFSGFTQLFARGQAFTYGLKNIGRYYRTYVDLMDHWDQLLPGKVLRVHYEDVVSDIETQVHRILDHCGLPFEAQCLEFHRTRRAVRTASSEQVRQPIYKDALEHWRHYEAHLDELKSVLGPVLERYPVKDVVY